MSEPTKDAESNNVRDDIEYGRGLLANTKIYKGMDNLWYPFNAPGGPFKTREEALAAYWYNRDLISGKSDKKSDPRWAMGATE
jgi:hypothetical protein